MSETETRSERNERRRDLLARIALYLGPYKLLDPLHQNTDNVDSYGVLRCAETGDEIFIEFSGRGNNPERGHVVVKWPRDGNGEVICPLRFEDRPSCTFNPKRQPARIADDIRRKVIGPASPLLADIRNRITRKNIQRDAQLETARVLQTQLGASAQYRQGNDLCVSKGPITAVVSLDGTVQVSVRVPGAHEAKALIAVAIRITE